MEDAKAAQTAVAQALTVLKEFYAKAAEATALLQQEPPPMPEEPYKGMGGEAGGVVGMLEVIESDFARLESETKANEVGEEQGRRAQDDQEAGRRGSAHHCQGRSREREEGAHGRHEVLRQVEAVLRGLGCELRGTCQAAEGRNRIFAGGAQNPQRRRHGVR